ncbi:MFS transporter [Streptosporangium sp. NPDC023615]|uniref:MFS transporter n=1 Tax=Streptosporangium sp. NPDC023615 TaxID=3154794 RepID=UPI00343B03A2
MPPSPPRTVPPPSRRRWIALGIVLSAAFMDNVDATIIGIALPRIQRDLGADHTAAQWSLAGYALAFALLLITGGRLGDIFGRKRLFLIGVAGFTAASVACGAAMTPGALVGGRLAQGAMAALMVPQVMSVIVAMFGPAERTLAFSLLGAVLSLGSVSAPLLGGLLTEYDVLGTGWRAIFYVNVPVGILAFCAAARFMPETRSDRPLRLDLTGVALVTLATLGIMYPLVRGQAEDRPAWTFAVMTAGVVTLGLFVVQQRWRHRRDGSALVPPPLFRRRSFTAGVIVVLLVFSGVTSFFLVLTYQLQSGLEWTPLRTALVTLAWPVGITATTHLALRHGTAHGRRLIGAGALTMAAGTLVMIVCVRALGADLAWPHVVAAELVIGFGMGLCVPILTGVVLGDVPADDAGAGSGVVNTGIQFGTAAGITIVGVVFFALVAAGTGDLTDRFGAATATTLWYNVGVFALAALLSPLLPAPSTAGSEVAP